MSGSHRTTVDLSDTLPELDWQFECQDIPEAWPYVGPTWLRGTERAMPEARAWYAVARRARGELAVLPGFVLDKPGAVDFDPRTYLGWKPASGDEVCCGVATCETTIGEVEKLGEDAFYPAMILGSPLGYRSEGFYTFWTPRLFPSLVDALVSHARSEGVKTVMAPWIPQRRGNEAIVSKLVIAGGQSAFWGYEDYIPLREGSYDAHVAAMPARKRRRLKEDLSGSERAGVELDRIDGDSLRPLIPHIAALTCANREKNGAGEETRHITPIFTELLDAGADVRCYVARKDSQIVACCVTIRKVDRLFVKWVGFDYEALGDRSGVYFPMVFDSPMRDAYAEGLRVLELGAGAHQAKALRGARSRTKWAAQLVLDEELQPRVAEWMAEFGRRRLESFAAGSDVAATAPLSLVGGGVS
jgi:hypothetical protein